MTLSQCLHWLARPAPTGAGSRRMHPTQLTGRVNADCLAPIRVALSIILVSLPVLKPGMALTPIDIPS